VDAVHESVALPRVDPDGANVAAAAIVIDSCVDAVCPAESVTVKVKVLVPALVGVPDKTPADVNVIPVLHAPLQAGSVQVYGAVPFTAASVVEYAVPTVPAGSEVVVIVSVAAAATDVPLRETDCGLAAALSVNVMAPVGVPAAVGVKVTEMVQLAPAGKLEGQAVVSAKLPEAAIPLIERATAPVFVKVIVCAALVVPTVWLAKLKLVGEKLTAGADAAAIVTANCFDAVCPAESVTVKVNVLVPALVGVPDRTPVEEKPIPVLQEPLQDGSVQVYGAVPFAAAKVVE
jgi:hypothetical protein